MIERTYRIERLVPELAADFLAVFATADRALARGSAPLPPAECGFPACHCHYYHLAPAVAWESLDADANRTAIIARIGVAEMDGFLAYDGDRPVGWLNAQPLNRLPHAWTRLAVTAPALGVPTHAAAVVLCFVVTEPAAQAAIARALLEGALRSFQARGLRRVYALPETATRGDVPVVRDRGTAELFFAAGFTVAPAGNGGALLARDLPGGLTRAPSLPER